MTDRPAQSARPDNTEIAFYRSANRDAARYVSGTTVREEAMQHGRLIGLYWSASGQVQRENITEKLPGLDPHARPLHVFELEIDGQSLHNRWDWVGASERPGERPGTVEAVVELRHQVRPVTVYVVTRLDGSAVLTRWLEITNTGPAPAALSHVSPWSGLLWNTDPKLNPSLCSPPYQRGKGGGLRRSRFEVYPRLPTIRGLGPGRRFHVAPASARAFPHRAHTGTHTRLPLLRGAQRDYR